MINLLKRTYLLDVNGIIDSMESLWSRYQAILDSEDHSWEELNEARAILYLLGYLYPEKIALESLEARIALLEPPLETDEFLRIIDSNDIVAMEIYQEDILFDKLKNFYSAVKGMKNRVRGDSYLDEDRFNEAYRRSRPEGHI